MRVTMIFLFLLSAAGKGAANEGNLCDVAAEYAAARTGVPADVMKALTRTETGRRMDLALQPWPWTVNMEGRGYWFDTAEEAKAFVFKRFKTGARSFDVGCFQINYKWHGGAFQSIEQMFDPQVNATYAAKFLDSLKSAGDTWVIAAGRYHSRTPEYAEKYRQRFRSIHAGLADEENTPSSPPAEENRYPLLTASTGSAQMGSLVQITNNAARPLFQIEENG